MWVAMSIATEYFQFLDKIICIQVKLLAHIVYTNLMNE